MLSELGQTGIAFAVGHPRVPSLQKRDIEQRDVAIDELEDEGLEQQGVLVCRHGAVVFELGQAPGDPLPAPVHQLSEGCRTQRCDGVRWGVFAWGTMEEISIPSEKETTVRLMKRCVHTCHGKQQTRSETVIHAVILDFTEY